jgi:hypothetical protein
MLIGKSQGKFGRIDFGWVQGMLVEKFGGAKFPAVQTLNKWYVDFLEGDFNRKAPTKSAERTEEENRKRGRVLQESRADPNLSIRRIANATSISRMSVQRILKNEGFHPYKIQILQELKPEHKVARVVFAQDQLRRLQQDLVLR